MLHFMQTATKSPPSSTGFASLLSALVAPRPEARPNPGRSNADWTDPNWTNEVLADDIATLSYESALRSHARYSGNSREERAPAGEPPVPVQAPLQTARDAEWVEAPTPPTETAPTHRTFRPFERHLKNASITIRMSKSESEQLHQRADEAGMTVSAYLRSCTFEAEALRAQVKEALAELRTAVSREKIVAAPARRSLWSWLRFGWLARLLPQVRTGHRVAQA